MTNPPAKVNSYSLTCSNARPIIKYALQILKPYLPVSLPLYRRLQFGRFFDATTLVTNLELTRDTVNGESSIKEESSLDVQQCPEPWLIAFTDRSCRPETEVWLFASWEPQIESKRPSPEEQEAMDALLTSLLQSMKALPLPISIHQHNLTTPEDLGHDSAGISRTDYASHASFPSIMLWGAIHEATVRMVVRLDVLARGFKTGLVPNHTFIWDVDALANWDERALPEGLRWGHLASEDFALVKARTQIPRQDRTLAVLPNVGVFDKEGRAVAWAFVGLDGSLTTLHVEEEYRGRGLAKAVTTKLLREKMGGFWEAGLKRWAHGYVVVGNRESEGMCRSLGGWEGSRVYWLRVDLGAVR